MYTTLLLFLLASASLYGVHRARLRWAWGWVTVFATLAALWGLLLGLAGGEWVAYLAGWHDVP